MLHKIKFCALVVFLITHCLYAQNSPSDVSFELRITDNLASPVRMAIDSHDNIYITDEFNKIVNKYDALGNLLLSISNIGSPISIAINSEDQLFIGDSNNGQVFKVNTEGNITAFYTGSKFPSSMVFGIDNNLYIADSFLNEVSVVSPSGDCIKRIGTGQLKFPTGLAFDFKNERIVVAEHGATEDTTAVSIFIFDLEGNLISEFGSEADYSWFGGVQNPGDGQFSRIQGVAVSRCGTIFIIDPFQSKISVFDENAAFKTKFGQYGSEDGQFDIPIDIILDSENRILISSLNNGALDIFSFSDFLPTSNIKLENTVVCLGETIDIPIHFSGEAPWDFTYSIDGIDQPPISATQTPYVLSASIPGLYEVTALSDVNASGTCFSGSVEISFNSIAPTVTMSCDSSEICTGEVANINIDFTGTPPWTFEYTFDGQNPISITTNDNSYVLNTDVAGLYEVVSIVGGGCAGSTIAGSVQVIAYELPTAKVISSSNYFRVSNKTPVSVEIQFTGEAPFTFTYSNNETGINAITTSENPYTITVGTEGTYEIIAIEDANCLNSIWQDYFDVNYNIPILPTATFADANLSICRGDNVDIPILLTGTSPWEFTYVIDGQYPTNVVAETSPYYLNVDTAGEYKIVELSDAKAEGVEFNGSTTIEVLALPVSNFFYQVNELEVQFINGSFEADSYFWDFGNGNSSIEESPLETYSEEGTYTVSLTAYNSFCDPVTMLKDIKVGGDILSSGIDKNYKKYTVMVYPNPSHGELTLKISPKNMFQSDIKVLIQNTSGQIIFNNEYDLHSVTFYNGSYYIDITLRNFAKGIYILYVQADNYYEPEKLILKD